MIYINSYLRSFRIKHRYFALITLSSLLMIVRVTGQNLSDGFSPIQCMGPIPEIWKNDPVKNSQVFSEKLKRENQNSSITKIENEVAYSTMFVLDKLFNSGQVTYGDTITNYLSGLLDKLLKEDSVLRAKIHIYYLRSSIINAFAFETGDIFVSSGLLSRVKNEDQLAFVLCHEIQHIKNKHVLNTQIKLADVSKKNKSISIEQLLNEYSSYSKENELVADKLGFQLYTQNGYSPHQVIALLKLIDIENPSFYRDSFSFKFLDSVNYVSKKEHKDPLESSKSKTKINSTHPSAKLRISTLKVLIKDTLEKIAPIESESIIYIGRLAKLECIYYAIISGEYYLSLYLNKEYENNYIPGKFNYLSHAYSCLGLLKYNCKSLPDTRMSHFYDNDLNFDRIRFGNHELINLLLLKEIFLSDTSLSSKVGALQYNALETLLEASSEKMKDKLKKRPAFGKDLVSKIIRELYDCRNFRVISSIYNNKQKVQNPYYNRLLTYMGTKGRSLRSEDEILLYFPFFLNLQESSLDNYKEMINKMNIEYQMQSSINRAADKLRLNIKYVNEPGNPDNATEKINWYIRLNDHISEVFQVHAKIESNRSILFTDLLRDTLEFKNKYYGFVNMIFIQSPMSYYDDDLRISILEKEKIQIYGCIVYDVNSGTERALEKKIVVQKFKQYHAKIHTYDLIYQLKKELIK